MNFSLVHHFSPTIDLKLHTVYGTQERQGVNSKTAHNTCMLCIWFFIKPEILTMFVNKLYIATIKAYNSLYPEI